MFGNADMMPTIHAHVVGHQHQMIVWVEHDLERGRVNLTPVRCELERGQLASGSASCCDAPGMSILSCFHGFERGVEEMTLVVVSRDRRTFWAPSFPQHQGRTRKSSCLFALSIFTPAVELASPSAAPWLITSPSHVGSSAWPHSSPWPRPPDVANAAARSHSDTMGGSGRSMMSSFRMRATPSGCPRHAACDLVLLHGRDVEEAHFHMPSPSQQLTNSWTCVFTPSRERVEEPDGP
jgi:hypothetical protein